MIAKFVEVNVVGSASPRKTMFRVGAIDRLSPVFGADEAKTLLVSSGVSYSLCDEYEEVKRKIAAALRQFDDKTGVEK